MEEDFFYFVTSPLVPLSLLSPLPPLSLRVGGALKRKFCDRSLFFASYLRIQPKTIERHGKGTTIESFEDLFPMHSKALRVSYTCQGDVWRKRTCIWPGALLLETSQFLRERNIQKEYLLLPTGSESGSPRALQQKWLSLRSNLLRLILNTMILDLHHLVPKLEREMWRV